MTHAEIVALVADACGESELHASYTFTPKQNVAVRCAVHAVLIGVKERLDERLSPMGRKRSAPSQEGTP